MGLENVNHVVLVLSGKGGVGKSSVTLQLALALSQQGHNVGILDIDLTGPSIPRLLNLEDRKVRQAPGGWLPVPVHEATNRTETQTQKRGSLHALSLAFLLPSRDSAVIWRGPKKTAMIRQFVSDVLWPPNTDYLLIDTPPGTSDEHIAIVEELHKLAMVQPTTVNGQPHLNISQPAPSLAGAVVVTTPQAISTSDVRKELNFCVKTQVPVLGVIENMSGYMCPCCGEVSNVFSKGGGEVMAQECGVPYLGSVPIDTTFGELVEGVREAQRAVGEQQESNAGSAGVSADAELVERYKQCGLCRIFNEYASKVVGVIGASSSGG